MKSNAKPDTRTDFVVYCGAMNSARFASLVLLAVVAGVSLSLAIVWSL